MAQQRLAAYEAEIIANKNFDGKRETPFIDQKFFLQDASLTGTEPFGRVAYLSGNSRPEFPIDTDLQEMLSRQNGLIDAENQRQEAYEQMREKFCETTAGAGILCQGDRVKHRNKFARANTQFETPNGVLSNSRPEHYGTDEVASVWDPAPITDCDVPYPESQNDGLSTGTSADCNMEGAIKGTASNKLSMPGVCNTDITSYDTHYSDFKFDDNYTSSIPAGYKMRCEANVAGLPRFYTYNDKESLALGKPLSDVVQNMEAWKQ